MIVASIRIQRATITIKPSNGDFRPKNIIDQRILKKSWIKKIFSPFLSFFHTRNMAIPINKNKAVQTGANSQFGGLKDGLIKVGYQVLTAGAVKIEPTIPANSQTTIAIINFPKFFIKITINQYLTGGVNQGVCFDALLDFFIVNLYCLWRFDNNQFNVLARLLA